MKWNYDWLEESEFDDSRGPIAIGQIVPAMLARYGLGGCVLRKRAASALPRGVQAEPAPPRARGDVDWERAGSERSRRFE
jgi:hypothetical protein